MPPRSKTNPPRSIDFQFTWVVRELGAQWEHWRAHAANWFATHSTSTSDRLFALRTFLEAYLHEHGLPPDPAWLLQRANVVPDFYETACPKSYKGASYSRFIRDFMQWVLEEHFSEPDDHGRRAVLPLYHNPIAIRSCGDISRPVESVRSPLPYRFIRELRDILAPGKNFRDWEWAQQAVGNRPTGANAGDWFEIDPCRIDRSDPDCVWRVVPPPRRGSQSGELTQLWSPVRSMALLAKLTLPLRTYQVLMLDSGEADTWRYAGAAWQLSKQPLADGNARKPVRRGIFRRVEDQETGEVRTVLYINTNKTADIGKDEHQRGYVIPWQHDELLYWLEKLRNWQEKYNPVAAPVPWTELEFRHIKNVKTQQELSSYPDTCFLFRHAAGLSGDRSKPIPTGLPERLWYLLLEQLQRRCAQRGDTLADGRALQFVEPPEHSNQGLTTLFPLHSLRVSLLTCMALDGEVPLVVLSKLVAGHTRLLMTLYYTKPGVVRMTQTLNAASEQLDRTAAAGLQRFLQEASYEQLRERAVCNNVASALAALPIQPQDRNPAGWMARHHGLCLVGGNTSPDEANGRTGGCFNGGELMRDLKHTPSNIYAAVPGGAGNCVRCRWFVTEPHYIDALRAHFNNVSYRLAEAARNAKERESELDALKLLRLAAERAGLPFAELQDYLKAERVWESAMSVVDQLANDLTATFRLISMRLGAPP